MPADPFLIAKKARIRALNMTHKAKAAHVGSSLSVIDILSVLYCETLATASTKDVVLISKGHAAAGAYAVLCELGIVPSEWTDNYCVNGSPLGGHVTSINVPILELSTGSLGHALPYGAGRALGKKIKRENGRVFVVLSDGEMDEGSNWEAILFSAHNKLTNLTVIIDRNRLQSLSSTETTISLEPLRSKWESFNWEVHEVDGHNYKDLHSVLFDQDGERPRVVIAETIKGKGVSFMENQILWHYRSPDIEELSSALKELQ